MKCLILMTYFNRPKLLEKSLQSLLNNDYINWELVICDDNSTVPAEPIVNKIMSNCLEKIKIIKTNDSVEDKIKNGLSIGRLANEVIKNSNADFAIFLSDDDELCSSALNDLCNFYQSNPHIKYCYSNIFIYNPIVDPKKTYANIDNKFNQNRDLINCAGKVDVSQVSFRLSCCKQDGAWFEENNSLISNIDASFFQNLFNKCGPAHFSGLTIAYKGVHDFQLVWYKDGDEKTLRNYFDMVNELGGDLF